MDVLGIDIGFGFTKACNSNEHLMFKSIFGDAVDIQFQSDFGNGSQNNNLHVTIKEYHKRFAEILTGQHEITFHRHDGSMVNRQIFIRKILMMPQPLGSFFNLLMDDNGKITNADFAKQKIGVIDIGFRTTDITMGKIEKYRSMLLDVSIHRPGLTHFK
jgi:hypothetical protein